MNWKKLAKYLSKEFPPEELEKMSGEIKKNESDNKIVNGIRRWWPEKLPNNNIHLSTREKEAIWDQVNTEIDRTPTRQLPLIKWGVRIAASICLILVAYLIWPSNQKVITSKGQKSEITLADGSTVFLNHSSSLKYQKSFGQNSREIRLKGEGFFDVRKNPELPFVINTGSTTISVLGTSFNVFSRNESNTIEVTVVTGKVLFSRNNKEEIIMPGQKGIYDKASDRLYKVQQEGLNALAWHNGKLEFQSTSFDEIKKTLENVFNVKIEVSNPDVYNCTVTSIIHFQNPEDALEVLALTMGFEYEILKDIIKISGNGCH